jgi:hypothetical protein
MKAETEAGEQRKGVLERAAIAVGVSWVAWWRDELRRQGRPAAGGWPGTISEARARVVARVSADLGRNYVNALTSDELEFLAKTAYGKARDDWRANMEPEEP